MAERRAIVIGGGITGLAAAIELLDGPFDTVELREGDDRLGGKIAASDFAGVPDVDEGADSFLARIPFGVALAEHVGIDDMVSPTGATAMVWHDGLHDIPGGILLGLPAAIRPFVTTSLLSWRGKLRAAAEPLLPRREHDDHLGALVRHRFGDEVHERLVDALVGSIYAADTDRWSLASVPQLAGVASSNRSLLVAARRARRAAPPSDAPIFSTPRRGVGHLVARAADHLARHGAVVRTGTAVASVTAADGRWRVDDDPFDAVVFASPARATSGLLGAVAPEAAQALGQIGASDVAMVRLAVPDLPERLTGRSGYLVPKPDQRLVTAASFGSQKWAHWQPPSGDQILRVSLGRDGLPVLHLDDEAIIEAAVTELGHHVGADIQPNEASVTRWRAAFAQYRPHHHRLVAGAADRLPAGLVLAGASYHGIGIPACIASGRAAARRIKEATSEADEFLT